MKVIADSGSTKTHWRIISSDGSSESLDSVGLNPFFIEAKDLVEVMEHCFHLQELKDIEEVYFYGAGCAGKEKCDFMKEVLSKVFFRANIHVHSDLLASAHALFGDQPGVACILGTGSNAAVYNGQVLEEKINSLGYILGDEGSGSYIGKQLLLAYFRQEMPSNIRKDFQDSYQISRQSTMDNIYRKPFPNRYLASFAPFASKHNKTDFIRDLIKKSFSHFVDYQLSTLHFDSTMEVGFVGSVSFYFKDILKEVLAERGYIMGNVLKEPIAKLMQFYSVVT